MPLLSYPLLTGKQRGVVSGTIKDKKIMGNLYTHGIHKHVTDLELFIYIAIDGIGKALKFMISKQLLLFFSVKTI